MHGHQRNSGARWLRCLHLASHWVGVACLHFHNKISRDHSHLTAKATENRAKARNFQSSGGGFIFLCGERSSTTSRISRTHHVISRSHKMSNALLRRQSTLVLEWRSCVFGQKQISPGRGAESTKAGLLKFSVHYSCPCHSLNTDISCSWFVILLAWSSSRFGSCFFSTGFVFSCSTSTAALPTTATGSGQKTSKMHSFTNLL